MKTKLYKMCLCIGILFYNNSICVSQFSQEQLQSMVIKDESLIVPGVGACGTALNMSLRDVMMLKGKPSLITREVSHDLFRDVLKITSNVVLPFNYIYIYNVPFTMIGFVKERVSYIAVWEFPGVLIEGVSVSKGIMAIIFRYGNNGLQCIKERNSTIYIYPLKGIAFIDDGNDDSVDGVVVFPTVSQH